MDLHSVFQNINLIILYWIARGSNFYKQEEIHVQSKGNVDTKLHLIRLACPSCNATE
ncbi:MAG: hypothetical protein ACFFCS_05320 [Candidatus Hodarchaeota archaeon]